MTQFEESDLNLILVTLSMHPIYAIKYLLVMGLHLKGVRSLSQNKQEHRIRHKIETRKLATLLFQITFERFLALLEFSVQSRQRATEQFVATA